VLILALYARPNVASHVSISSGEHTTALAKKQPFDGMQALPNPWWISTEKSAARVDWQPGVTGFNIRLFPLEQPCHGKNALEKKARRNSKYLDKKAPEDYL
jgi:hypothetical protein